MTPRDTLILDNLHLARWVASRLWTAGRLLNLASREDAVQEATLVLIRCAQYWQASRGVEFSTYAVCAMTRMLLRANASMAFVRIPEHRRWTEPYVPVGGFPSSDGDTWEPAEKQQAFSVEEAWDMRAALRVLTPVERRVVSQHFGLGRNRPASLAVIGKRLGVTKQRAAQIKDEALAKLKEVISDEH